MGIPRLTSALEQFAELRTLGGQELVIDGPAFAYHVYYLCLRSKQEARGPFDAAPSYAQICGTAIAFLRALEDSGASIKKIYFDGFLPPSKFDVRIVRLITLTRRMSDYFYANQTINVPTVKHDEPASTLFGGSAVPSRLTAIPPPPFLVPAVLECLLDSSVYNSLTQVVSGEADVYCSLHLKRNGGIVLTGDSDLLVHDLGPSGMVGFLRDMHLVGSGALKCQIYWPAAIAERLSLPSPDGIHSLAFEMKRNPQDSFTQLVSRAKSLKSAKDDPTCYSDFRSEYKSLVRGPPQSSGAQSSLSQLQHVDPRISEFLLHYPYIAGVAGGGEGLDTLTTVHVFLPFLIDIPTKTSAWEMPASIRQLAYSLANLVVPKDQHGSSVFEHKKQTDKSNGREMTLYMSDEMRESCTKVLESIRKLRHRLPNIIDRDFWLVVAIYQDMDYAHTNSKTSTAALAKQQLSRGKVSKTTSWDVIQFHAQVEATYYSFRMLKQICNLVIALGRDTKDLGFLTDLQSELATLPALRQLHDLSEMSPIMQLIDENKVFDVIYDILGIQKKTTTIADDTKTAKKKRKREQAAALKRHTKSNNPFALLETD